MIEKMIDDKLRTQVPLMIEQYNNKQRVDVEAYFNGKPATDENIIAGVRNMMMNALKHVGSALTHFR